MRISIYNELAIIGPMRSREVIYDEWNTGTKRWKQGGQIEGQKGSMVLELEQGARLGAGS